MRPAAAVSDAAAPDDDDDDDGDGRPRMVGEGPPTAEKLMDGEEEETGEDTIGSTNNGALGDAPTESERDGPPDDSSAGFMVPCVPAAS